MGLLTAPLTLVRAPIRVGLKAAEVGLSTAAEVARIGTELLSPGREGSPDFSEYGTPVQPDYAAGNGGAPDVEYGSPAEPAAGGVGPELTVETPWEGYDQMTAADIRDRLSAATAVEAAAVELYESAGKRRRTVIDAAARVLSR